MAKKHKKHKKHEEHMDESWLVPYADILTLLLALFIVLFASSTVDQNKLNQLSAVFNDIFTSGTGVMDNPAVIQTPNGSSSNIQSGASKYMEDQERLKESQNRVDEFIAVNELEKQFETKLTEEGLLITIRDSVLFDTGRADVKAEYDSIADELSKLLMFNPPRNIVITGHTDNVPINTNEFDSNWDLSVMRAVNFMKEVVAGNKELDPKYFSVKGFGEYSPIASNDTEEGRAKNRRVEVLVQPRVTEAGEVIVE
ncbi:flagellar motor protein MotB [Solibacillus sp. MA9]|uniref:Flagellar motor protein MotB n=1 Tax=Solibacillus palustris TaxID=2908203 RepID=A0ABS9UFV3_9BACL|nr:flagellar motor protein MotB [Solibacillus sp. MA9]MCH7323224.1 flagellar motor protein MotB [Solibacillus sp. MA9]